MKYLILFSDGQYHMVDEANLPMFNGNTLFNVHAMVQLGIANPVKRVWCGIQTLELTGLTKLKGFMYEPMYMEISPDEFLCMHSDILLGLLTEERNYMLFIYSALCNMVVNKLNYQQALIDLHENQPAQLAVINEYNERLKHKAELKALLKD